jgi:hypothetical protein
LSQSSFTYKENSQADVDRILACLSNIIGEAPGTGALYSLNGTPAREEKNGHEQNEVTIPDVRLTWRLREVRKKDIALQYTVPVSL